MESDDSGGGRGQGHLDDLALYVENADPDPRGTSCKSENYNMRKKASQRGVKMI